MDSEQLDTFLLVVKKFVIEYSPKIIGAFLILIIGLFLINIIIKMIKKAMQKRNIEPALTNFLNTLALWGLRILLFVIVISKLGVQTSSFVAILGAAGLAVGLALQGSLSNFAGGVLIILLKPFKIGDLIEAQGEIGVVKEIHIFSTIIITPDNKQVVIPNAALSNGNIKNFTINGKLRVDLTIGVSYDSDLKKVKETALSVLTNNPDVLQEPKPDVFVVELADSSINIAIRPWATPANYWKVYAETLENCKTAFDDAAIEIPFPHQVEIRK